MPSVLSDIYREIYANSQESKMDNLRDLAERLNKLTGANWTYRYLNSILTGSLEPSKKLIKTIDILGNMLDGQSPIQARLNGPIMVFSINGLQDNDIVLGRAKRCRLASCRLRFVPPVPWQIYCCPEHRRKSYKIMSQNK